eukprot:4700488-Amphidinium_carterae.1
MRSKANQGPHQRPWGVMAADSSALSALESCASVKQRAAPIKAQVVYQGRGFTLWVTWTFIAQHPWRNDEIL